MLTVCSYAQKEEVNPNGLNIFYHENGNIASEGSLRNGEPDGYWKTFYENGTLKSEGNRKNFQLDSIWTFYNEEGNKTLVINYLEGKKNGARVTYRENEYIEEHFVNDQKQGLTTVYFSNGKVKSTTNFINGLENGLSKTFNEEGVVVLLVEYKSGFVVSRESINHTDMKGDQQGRWVFFWDNGKIRLEGNFRDGRKHGYFKSYDRNGDLLTVEKYDNGIKQVDAAEVATLDLRTDYYPDGTIKTVAGYRNGKPEGIRREYDKNGAIKAAFIFSDGILTGEGIIDERMKKDGPWKEYYPNGALMAEGNYSNDKRVGKWSFYYLQGNIQQEGFYNKLGNYDGEWRWFFESGQLLRIEYFLNGREDGETIEYDEAENEVVKGQYVDGLEEGTWTYNLGDIYQSGTFRSGMRNGMWITKSKDGTLLFKGEFIDDNPNGRHLWFWDNGKIKDDATYLMGQRHGEWTKYDYEGNPFITISYRNGKELRYDGITINEKE